MIRPIFRKMKCAVTALLSKQRYLISMLRGGLSSLALMACLTACTARAPLEPPEPPMESTDVGPEPTRPDPKPIQSELPTIAYTIQVGAFSTTERAARFSLGLKRQGLDAYYFIDRDGLYKVRFERFDDKSAARRRALELQSLGRIDTFYVVQPGRARAQINPQDALRKSIVKTAHRFIGTPYRWGGESAGRGFDCSGLTMTVYRLNGLELPRNSRSQYRAGKPVGRRALRKGDLVFFATNGGSRVSHVGVYTGAGKFIHAPGRGKRIRTSSLDKGYFKQRYMGGRRYF